METELAFKNSVSLYSRDQKETKTKNESGYDYYHYKDEFYSYLDLEAEEYLISRFQDPYFVWLNAGTSLEEISFEWEITNDVSEFLGFKIQKALIKPLIDDPDNQKRKAIAWFTPDIPIPHGPEGYAGLPGLILKLEYPKWKTVTLTATSVSFEEIETPQKLDSEEIVEVSFIEIFNTNLIDKKWLKKQKKLLDSGE